jgi:hypothetical protein
MACLIKAGIENSPLSHRLERSHPRSGRIEESIKNTGKKSPLK